MKRPALLPIDSAAVERLVPKPLNLRLGDRTRVEDNPLHLGSGARYVYALLAFVLASTAGFSADAKRPNILFAIADDWGAHAGAYGTTWIKTPAFDRVAREGLLFKNAFTPNAKCAPSRAILLTGRQSWQLEDAGNQIGRASCRGR